MKTWMQTGRAPRIAVVKCEDLEAQGLKLCGNFIGVNSSRKRLCINFRRAHRTARRPLLKSSTYPFESRLALQVGE